jgi:xanthine dehydrogenase accessory factor
VDDIYSILEAITQKGKKVLATIICVQGSAYKKEGSAMLFFEDGSHVGMLSTGCLEEDLLGQMKKVLTNGKAITIRYDTRQETDFEWGQGPGCNGIIEVLLEPVTQKLAKDLLAMKKCLDSNIPVFGLKKIQSNVEYIFIPKEGEPFGNWKGDIPIQNDANSRILTGKSIFQHVYQPKPRLIVFGAGTDAMPLVTLAKTAGFSVFVCDWREKFCNKKNFPSADSLIIGYPKEIMSKLEFTPYDHLVIMSHQFQKDQEILLSLLQKKVKYLGVLGSKERTKRLLIGNAIPNWVHSPVGIAIGAKGPDEIAISIVAEMLYVLRNPIIKKVKNLWMIPD